MRFEESRYIGGSTSASPGLRVPAGAWDAESQETGARVSGLDAVRYWTHLLLMKVPDDIVKALSARKMRVQYAHNESYSNDLNIDLYPVRINRFPLYQGARMTPERLISYIRLNINTLIDTSISRFSPYGPVDIPRLASNNPVGAVLRITIRPDNAAVVVSSATPTGWTFTTIETPTTGNHPVSGHRNFFIAKREDVYYFFNKGLDMTSSGIAGLGLPVGGEIGYRMADKLFLSLQKGLTNFINANGGDAKAEQRYSRRIAWRFVYHRYKQALERVFGKGAGSARNSPFFDVFD